MEQTKKPLVFTIQGMDCAEEISTLKSEVGPLVGGNEHLSFDLLNQRMTVEQSAEKEISTKDIIAAITRAGLKAQVIIGDAPPKGADQQDNRRQRLIVTFAAHRALY